MGIKNTMSRERLKRKRQAIAAPRAAESNSTFPRCLLQILPAAPLFSWTLDTLPLFERQRSAPRRRVFLIIDSWNTVWLKSGISLVELGAGDARISR